MGFTGFRKYNRKQLKEMAEEERATGSLLNSERDELIPRREQPSSKSGWTFWLVYTAAVVVLGSSFQFGYSTSCMNAPEKVSFRIILSFLGVTFRVFEPGKIGKL